jgi:hypothetical protein
MNISLIGSLDAVDPSRSPDLTPPDIFLWGSLKNEVYAQKPRRIEQLKEKIVDACDKITADS